MQKWQTRESKHVWLIVKQPPMKADWWDAPLALWDLAKAISIISGNGLPLLTENNFQTPPTFYLDPPVYWYLGYLSDPPPPFIKTPLIIWNWRVKSKFSTWISVKILENKILGKWHVSLSLVRNLELIS